MTIPLFSFFLIYLLFLFVFLILSIVNFSHVAGTGSITLTSSTVTILTLLFVAVVFLATFYLLNDTDWQTPVTLWNSSWVQNLFSLKTST